MISSKINKTDFIGYAPRKIMQWIIKLHYFLEDHNIQPSKNWIREELTHWRTINAWNGPKIIIEVSVGKEEAHDGDEIKAYDESSNPYNFTPFDMPPTKHTLPCMKSHLTWDWKMDSFSKLCHELCTRRIHVELGNATRDNFLQYYQNHGTEAIHLYPFSSNQPDQSGERTKSFWKQCNNHYIGRYT